MPKKTKEEKQKDQSKRFDAEVRRLIDAGELNPDEADELFERAVRNIGKLPPE